MQVFGGSWGSTLALAYSQSHPDKVCLVFFIIIFCSTTEHCVIYNCGISFHVIYCSLFKYLIILLRGYWHDPQGNFSFKEERDWLVLRRWCCCNIPRWYINHSFCLFVWGVKFEYLACPIRQDRCSLSSIHCFHFNCIISYLIWSWSHISWL